MVIPPPGSVQPPPSTIPEHTVPISHSYSGLPSGFVPDSQITSGQMPQGPIGRYPVVPESSGTETSSGGSPVIPPRPQSQPWVTGEQDIGVVPQMPEPIHHPPQPHGRRPPSSESDEGQIVMPSGPHVVVQPPAETTQTVPIFVPPPGAIRPVSAGRRSSPSLSSSGSSRSSTPTQQAALSDVQRIPYRRYGSPRGGRTPSSSRSSISSRTPPLGPTTVINVTAPQPATTMMPTAPTMMPPQSLVGPPINVIPPPASPDHPGRGLARAQLPPIIIQPPVYPPQQLQQVPPVFTTVGEPRERHRRRSRRSSSSSPSSSSGTARSRSRERRRRRTYTPSRTSRTRSYTPTRRRRSRSRSYSPSRYSSRYYSPSRRSRSRTPTRGPSIPGQGLTVLPLSTAPSQFGPHPPTTTSSSETPPHPHEQRIFVQAPPPPGVPGVVQPGFVQPGILQPGMLQPGVVQPGDVVVHPGMPQPGGYMPGQTVYPPHPGPTYVPVTSTHRTRTHHSPSRSRSPLRRSPISYCSHS